MRTCIGCGLKAETKAQLEAFVTSAPSKYGRKNKCKECQKKYVQALKIGVRKLIADLKSVPCADCEKFYPTHVMDFDHVRGKKLFRLGDSAWKIKTKSRIVAEAAKCDIVCANCHRIRTFT